MRKIFKTGSRVFFGIYKDYSSHDMDSAIFDDEMSGDDLFRNRRTKNLDFFYFRLIPKDEFLLFMEKHAENESMAAGLLLCPEISEFIGITIDELKRFDRFFKSMDYKHGYQKLIYDAYVENNGFYLTQEQRDSAYQEYKKERQNKENKN